MPSLTFPPLSAMSLASFNPKPVKSLTNLITAILLAPAAVNTTLTFDGPSSTAATAGPVSYTHLTLPTILRV